MANKQNEVVARALVNFKKDRRALKTIGCMHYLVAHFMQI
jgi:hypothetical protein